MRNKKIIIPIVILILFFSIAVTFFLFKNSTKQNNDFLKNTKSSLFCAHDGETIGASGMPDSCCTGLKPLGGMPDGYNGDCSAPQPPTGLITCAKCGDGVCNNNYEGKCNCPEDCK